jgi:hypothetical protein
VPKPRESHRSGRALFLFAALATHVAAAPRVSADPAESWREEWEVAEGFALDIDTEGYRFPTSVAFVPRPGSAPKDPLYFVSELRGALKVVTNDRSVHVFAKDFFRLQLPYELPNMRAEIGIGAVCLDPEHGYVFASFAYQDDQGRLHNDIIRFETKPGSFALEPSDSVRFTDIFDEFPSSRSHQIGHMVIRDGTLFVAVGDALQSSAGRDLDSVLGKVLRMTLDGQPVRDNPFYSGSRPPRPRDYVWAYGLRNPFGLVAANGRLYTAENGPSVDRFLRIDRGVDHGYDGSDWSMGTNALAVFAPAVGPAQTAWVPESYDALPPEHRDAFYVTFGGSVLTPPGPGLRGERSVVKLAYDPAADRPKRTAEPVLRYRGERLQMPVGIATGPDGLYVALLFDVRGDSSAILRLSYDRSRDHPFRIDRDDSPAVLLAANGCNGCHASYEGQTSIGPSLDPPTLVARVADQLSSDAYRRSIEQIDALTDEPYASFRDARKQVLAADGKERVRLWLKYRILEPRFDTSVSLMPNQGVSEVQAARLADYFVEHGWGRAGLPGSGDGLVARMRALFPAPRYRHFLFALLVGLALGFGYARRTKG